MDSKSRMLTSLSRRPRSPSPPNTITVLSPTSTAECPLRAGGGCDPASSLLPAAAVASSRSHSPRTGSTRRTAQGAPGASSAAAPPTRYMDPRQATATAPVTGRALLLAIRVHVSEGRSSQHTSASRRPLRLPPTTKRPVPTTAAACRYLPAGARPDVVTFAHCPTAAESLRTGISAETLRCCSAGAAAADADTGAGNAAAAGGAAEADAPPEADGTACACSCACCAAPSAQPGVASSSVRT
mmetsp:Transcript_4414/g.13698  ORF Transcript_4414/g.13698 Transcript_4414/m.13698 type:complete len:242 (+) Transcript_4414:564-1289(+)